MKKIKETDIQRAICEYLTLKKRFFWRQNSTPVYDTSRKLFRAMPKYSMVGIPDIIVISDGGFAVFLEVKMEKGKLSTGQLEFKRRCEEVGAEYHVVRKLEDVIELGL